MAAARGATGAADTADLDRLEAEVEAEENDGSVVVTLSTEEDDADITVPPVARWRASAKNALFSRGDTLLWATGTLSPADARAWARLDPTTEESDRFFEAWGEASGQGMGESRASRRASARTRGR
ncbi:MAG TPA: hypothetical protein VK453_25400 [Micromonosporaceae bacterium]|nr:hypothetical protein [Micromonosporaceae bacterium]